MPDKTGISDFKPQEGSFEQVFQSIKELTSGELSDDTPIQVRNIRENIAFNSLNMSSELFRQVNGYLNSLGINHLRYEGNDESGGLNFLTHDNLQVKLNDKTQPSDIDVKDLILQPLINHTFSFRMRNLTLSILPPTRAGASTIRGDHVNALGIALAKKGYIFSDAQRANVGLLEDGTPVVTNPDAVNFVRKGEREEDFYQQWKYSKPDPNYSWEGKQEKFFSGLKEKFASRVVVQDQMPFRRRNFLDNSPDFTGQIA